MTCLNTTHYLNQPHHDTGPAYLLGTRRPGAELTARLWVPAPWQPEHIILRQVVDGEPSLSAAQLVARTDAGAWWEATLRLVNPTNHYRFLLLTPDSDRPYVWFHAAGLADHDVPDAMDFRVLAEDDAPDWVLDAVCYQIFPDRFSAHTPPRERTAPAWAQAHAWLDEPPVAGDPSGAAWYGGDLDGIVDHLDYLQELGVNTVYLTPVFPAGSVHRYDSTSFDHVDALLGGDAALARLTQALHDRDMRLVLDLTTNHTGVTHDWFRRAVTGRQLWLVAEHGHDASGDLTGTGWQGTMNYHGFTRPLWSWLAHPDPADGLNWLGIPTGIPRLPGGPISQGVREYTAHMPATSITHSMNLLGSHDTPRIRTVVGSREAQLVAATALFTAPGVPTVFSGDELGATGRTGEHSRTTMPWTAPPGAAPTDELGPDGAWGPVDRVALGRYRHLGRLRHELPALRRGGMRWVYADEDLLVWLRTHPDGDVLVALARAAGATVDLPLACLPAGAVDDVHAMDGVDVTVIGGADGHLTVNATGPGSAIVTLRAVLPRTDKICTH
ncbi:MULTISPECIES: alpha-amylase family glycosyl hydrolase [unclassified Actinomyces]|uniref:alpha-amylase family glycosyl hydrolase n=1 Tax=unclassified Actinomyces TaxID=2609248 RepID=UPI000D59CA99|nr:MULTISPECIES: alpha-amylase family glycosyl hydrolase [unclassified Actinomyces]RAX19894.1 glycoside hydrolase family 13 protein [Actinomyces sp. Z5]RAX23455.1 glycoside hydrolase family 13 protein [Actinomyces sp. Z3]